MMSIMSFKNVAAGAALAAVAASGAKFKLNPVDVATTSCGSAAPWTGYPKCSVANSGTPCTTCVIPGMTSSGGCAYRCVDKNQAGTSWQSTCQAVSWEAKPCDSGAATTTPASAPATTTSSSTTTSSTATSSTTKAPVTTTTSSSTKKQESHCFASHGKWWQNDCAFGNPDPDSPCGCKDRSLCVPATCADCTMAVKDGPCYTTTSAIATTTKSEKCWDGHECQVQHGPNGPWVKPWATSCGCESCTPCTSTSTTTTRGNCVAQGRTPSGMCTAGPNQGQCCCGLESDCGNTDPTVYWCQKPAGFQPAQCKATPTHNTTTTSPSPSETTTSTSSSPSPGPNELKKLSDYKNSNGFLTGQFVLPSWGNAATFAPETCGSSCDQPTISVCFIGQSADYEGNVGTAWGGMEQCLPNNRLYKAMKRAAPKEGNTRQQYWYSFGGGNPNPTMWFTAQIIKDFDDNIMPQLKDSDYTHIFYDVEVIYNNDGVQGVAGYESTKDAFLTSFSKAQAMGLKVALSTSHTNLYNPANGCMDAKIGVPHYLATQCNICQQMPNLPICQEGVCANQADASQKMCDGLINFPTDTNPIWEAVISSSNVNVVLPQMYGDGYNANPIASTGGNWSVADFLTKIPATTKIITVLKINQLKSQGGPHGTWDENIAHSMNTMHDACTNQGRFSFESDDAKRMCENGYLVWTSS